MMKTIGNLLLLGSILAAPCEARLSGTTRTTRTSSSGHTITQTRTVRPQRQAEAYLPDNRHKDDTLVDTPESMLRRSGLRKDNVQHEKEEHGRNLRHKHHHRSDDDKFHHHLDGHAAHEHSEHYYHHEKYHQYDDGHKAQNNHAGADDMLRGKRRQSGYQKESTTKKVEPLYILPQSMESHFNETLFELLHNAPFQIFEDATGQRLSDGESFPVFSMPEWYNTTGIFTAFSKTATPMVIEATQILLDWKNIQSTATGVTRSIEEYAEEHNFRASLILGRIFGADSRKSNFVGLVASYYQFGVEKNVLVPFGRIEDFFDGMTENHILNPSMRKLEMDTFNSMMQHKGTYNGSDNSIQSSHKHARKHSHDHNATSFAIPVNVDIKTAKEASMENIEITRFEQLFQVLIRRGFLFSYGYVDCLQQDPYNLRTCLDNVFYDIVRQETSTRGALDDELVEMYEELTEYFPQYSTEACINVQGGAMDYFGAAGSCYNNGALRGMLQSYVS